MLTLLLAHEDALKRGILHRDISIGNILIYKPPGGGGKVEGLLIDWDLCVDLNRTGEARRRGRTVSFMIVDPRYPG